MSAAQMPTVDTPVTLELIQEAAQRLQGHHVVTPVLESPCLNEQYNGRLLFKTEILQRTGSFKFRGAFNLISQLPEDIRTRGVVAYSSGNHAQAVAAAAQCFQIPALIVMPEDAPKTKIEGTRAFGAEVVFYNRRTDSREAIADALCRERDATLIPPYDHPQIMAGQGTVALELIEFAQKQNIVMDAVLIPCSGGGLSAGCATALKALSPRTEVILVEPAGYDDMALSLLKGSRQRINPEASTLCDSLMLLEPGKLTFPILQKLADKTVAVSDAEVTHAMQQAFQHLKLIVEPGGAAALAALLGNHVDATGKTLGVILSGGNVDAAQYAEILSHH